MEERPYTNRELDHHFTDIKASLTKIEEQTVKTNGRVTALEKWMWLVIGGLSLLAFLVGNKLLALHNVL